MGIGTGIVRNFEERAHHEDSAPNLLSEMMVGFTMKETTLREINDLLDNCRSLALEGYLGDIDKARENLKSILTDTQKVRNLIYESTLIGGR